MEIVFWQSIVSPHQAALVSALSRLPDMRVTYVATREMDQRRTDLGWVTADLGAAQLEIAPTAALVRNLAATFGTDAVHLCPGFRGNGVIAAALPALAKRGAKIGVMMEAVDQRGALGWLKLAYYRFCIRRMQPRVSFCLSIGAEAEDFLWAAGVPGDRVFPFTYFLNSPQGDVPSAKTGSRAFRVAYAGRLIALKRVDTLIDAISLLGDCDCTLTIAGDGPLRKELEVRAGEKLRPGMVEWLGAVGPERVNDLLSNADCLVLPSAYDGWGAVVTEALLAGVPAICSDSCGAAEAVRGSGCGEVFPSGSARALADLLCQQIASGKPAPNQRARLAHWADAALSGKAGAAYLIEVLQSLDEGSQAPDVPWRAKTLEN